MVKWIKIALPPKIGGTLVLGLWLGGQARLLLLHLLSSRPAPGGRGDVVFADNNSVGANNKSTSATTYANDVIDNFYELLDKVEAALFSAQSPSSSPRPSPPDPRPSR